MTPPEITCDRCGHADGPFDPETDNELCEHCAAPLPLDRLEPAGGTQ